MNTIRVLFVEHDERIATATENNLKIEFANQHDIEIVPKKCDSVVQALGLLPKGQNSYDVVVTDLLFPDENSPDDRLGRPEGMRVVRQAKLTPGVVAVALTIGSSEKYPRLEQETREAGVDIFRFRSEISGSYTGWSDLVDEIYATLSGSAGARANVAAQPNSPSPILRGEPETRETYFLAMDTVQFSTRTDAQQLTILRDLLSGCEHDEDLRRLRRDECVYLITGDGLIIGLSGDHNALVPLKSAMRLRRLNAELRGYQVRYGVHYGPANWLNLVDGSRQLIGHAVNWSARVMSAAGGNELLVSGEYYRQQIHPRRDVIGASFMEVAGLVTKLGEPIAAWRAVAPDSTATS